MTLQRIFNLKGFTHNTNFNIILEKKQDFLDMANHYIFKFDDCYYALAEDTTWIYYGNILESELRDIPDED